MSNLPLIINFNKMDSKSSEFSRNYLRTIVKLCVENIKNGKSESIVALFSPKANIGKTAYKVYCVDKLPKQFNETYELLKSVKTNNKTGTLPNYQEDGYAIVSLQGNSTPILNKLYVNQNHTCNKVIYYDKTSRIIIHIEFFRRQNPLDPNKCEINLYSGNNGNTILSMSFDKQNIDGMNFYADFGVEELENILCNNSKKYHNRGCLKKLDSDCTKYTYENPM